MFSTAGETSSRSCPHGYPQSKYKLLGLLATLLIAGGIAPRGMDAAELRLSWNHDSKDTSGYRIERATSSGAFARVASTGSSVTSYTDTGLSASTTYRYRVRAFNAYGESAPSSIVTATTSSSTSGNTGSTSPAGVALTSTDIGSPSLSGSTSVSNGTYTLKVGGSDIWGVSDQFRFAHQKFSGDAELVVRLSSLAQTNVWAKAGLMLRSSTGANSAHVSVFATPANGVRMQWRNSAGHQSYSSGANSAGIPQWLKLVRSGNTFTSYRSTNGSSWTKVHSVSVSLPKATLGGLAVTSHNTGARTTAAFASLAFKSGASGTSQSTSTGSSATTSTPTSTSTSTSTTSGTVAATLTSSDIGSPQIAGSTSLTDGILRIRAGGADIWNSSDQFRFARRSITGDAEITVRVSDLTNTNIWAKAGPMMRSSTSPSSPHVSVFVTPGAGVVLQWRDKAGGISSSSPPASGKAPMWLRLMRVGNSFYAFQSSDGAEWDLVEFVELQLPSTLLAGLAVTSHNPSTGATAAFHDLTIE